MWIFAFLKSGCGAEAEERRDAARVQPGEGAERSRLAS